MNTGNPLSQKEVINQNTNSFRVLCTTKKSAISYPEIHWWQFPLGSFSIGLKPEYKEVLFGKIYEERKKSSELSRFLNEKSRLYRKDWSFKKQRLLLYAYKKQTKFVPAWVIFWTAQYLGLELLEIEDAIESYVTFKGHLVVSSPHLPVKVTPKFTAIAIHTMCDGCNHLGAISYFQKEEAEKRRFLGLAKSVFGSYRTKYNEGSEILPKIFAKIISGYYNITDYSTFGARIPDKIKQQPFKHRLAALVAFILDEGNVSLGITLYSSNSLFLRDIREIAQSLGYSCSNLQTRKTKPGLNPCFKFRIRPKSIQKLYNDLCKLYIAFPTLKFGKKMDRIAKMHKIQTRQWKQRGKGKTRELIIKELEKTRKTSFELSESTEICLKTVYYHLKKINNISKTQEGNQIYYTLTN